MILKSFQLLANFAERQKADLRIIHSPTGNRVHRVGEPPIRRPKPVLSDGVVEHHVQDFAEAVGGFG